MSRSVYGGGGREWTQLASKLGTGEEKYTLKGEESIQFLFTKSETLDSFRFETKMRQNALNPISISIFPGVTRPDPRHWGLCPQTPGRGGRGGKRRIEGERAGERERGVRERGRRGREGERKFASLPLGDRRPCVKWRLVHAILID